MVLRNGQHWEARFRDRLEIETSTSGLDFLAFLFTPERGTEAMLVQVGKPPSGAYQRRVQSSAGSLGVAELHWLAESSSYGQDQAEILLADLQDLMGGDRPPSLADHLHATICQSLTAAHLHLELGLMTRPEAGEEFTVAQRLVHEATTSVRELIDELAGES